MNLNSTADIIQLIQLVVAPVFLLAGIGAFINAFAARLGRIFDRIRQLERELAASGGADREQLALDLMVLRRRVRLSHFGIALGTFSALLVCVLIVIAFTGYFFNYGVGGLIAGLFIAAMLALIGGLIAFLREISMAVRRLSGGQR
jgi:hypothetical protein